MRAQSALGGSNPQAWGPALGSYLLFTLLSFEGMSSPLLQQRFESGDALMAALEEGRVRHGALYRRVAQLWRVIDYRWWQRGFKPDLTKVPFHPLAALMKRGRNPAWSREVVVAVTRLNDLLDSEPTELLGVTSTQRGRWLGG